MLWKKEPSGLLIDIFTNVDSVDTESREIKFIIGMERSKKNNKTSTELRELGNDKIKERDWYQSMTLYNRSLRYAEIGTENVSLAYANRSLCFLKMGEYDKCLIDIKLAINAKYPQRLMSKLEERREFCLKQKNNAPRSSTQITTPKLDFDADENFPGMSNVLKMECNEKFGRHFVAKCDIDIGKVVMVEEAFVSSAIIALGRIPCNICDGCFKNSANFIACPHCNCALFCSEICGLNDIFHGMRCGRGTQDDDQLVEFTLRSLILTFDMFPGKFCNLANFVEKAINERDKGKRTPTTLVDMKSKYRLFLQLNLWLNTEDKQRMIAVGYEAFQIMKKHPEIRQVFGRPEVDRFLMHLSVMHASLILSNSYQLDVNAFVFLLRNHFNHSCAPNCLSSLYENKSIVITSRRIKKGDQLFTSYGRDYFFEPLDIRQKHLYRDFGFQSECEKCKNDNWPISSDRIESDPDYQFLIRAEKETKIFEVKKRVFLKKKCLDILIKYSDSIWCTQLDTISHMYQHLSTETMH